MMKRAIFVLLIGILSLPIVGHAQTKGTAASSATAQKKMPKIVLYSTSWCPHCRQVKEYFAANGIAYQNRDVEADPAAMDALQNKYKSTGVPLIVIGNDEKVLKGFTPEEFNRALDEVKKKR